MPTEGARFLLARNVVLNIVGQAVPALAALLAIPILFRGLGATHFGILALVWVALGYLTLFDAGLARAATRFAAYEIGRGRPSQLPRIIGSALALELLFGLLGAGLLYFASPLVLPFLLSDGSNVVAESTFALRAIAVALPFLLAGGIFRSALEAAQRFDLVNTVRSIWGTLAVVLPAAAVLAGGGILTAVALIATSLVATAFAYASFFRFVVSKPWQEVRPDPGLLRPLFRFGGWVTIASLTLPFLLYSDRLLVAGLLMLPSLAYYAISFEILSKIQVIPWSFATTLYPAFSAALRKEALSALFFRSLKLLIVILGPVMVAAAFLSKPFLKLWLGFEFVENAANIFQILTVGVLLNALSQLPANLLDAADRPDLRAKIFLAYVGPYLVLLFFLVERYGLMGAAFAWSIRGMVDFVALLLGAVWVLRPDFSSLIRSNVPSALLTFVAATGLSGVLSNLLTPLQTITFALLWVIVLAATSWYYFLDGRDRLHLVGLFSSIRSRRRPGLPKAGGLVSEEPRS